MSNNNVERILNESSYWVEGINGIVYDTIIKYMEDNNITKQSEIAKLLEVSASRVSQILNDGNINFSIEKIIELALKLDKFPVFEFIDKKNYLESLSNDHSIKFDFVNDFVEVCSKEDLANSTLVHLDIKNFNKLSLADY